MKSRGEKGHCIFINENRKNKAKYSFTILFRRIRCFSLNNKGSHIFLNFISKHVLQNYSIELI